MLMMLAVCSCQSHTAEYPDMDVPISIPKAENAVSAPPAPRPPATLYRDEVNAVVDAGLGSFLQRGEVDASLEHGHFRGFRILRLQPPEYWRGVDLEPGDVVTQVNGMDIERPPQAHRAFASLKTAPRLVVTYRRAGEQRQLVYRIQERTPAGQRHAPAAVDTPQRKPSTVQPDS